MEPITAKRGKAGDEICSGGDDGESFTDMDKAIIESTVALLGKDYDWEGRSGVILEGEEGGCTGLDNSNSSGGREYSRGGGGRGCSQKSSAPFLSKLLEMVEDPQTDEFISWSDTGRSFIVWDHLNFAANLMLKYFKHNNFSSFIYQLNSYGFKKIESNRWEYANPWFQAGKEHLLKNIKRRTTYPPSKKRKPKERSERIGRRSVESKLEDMRTNQNALEMEISMLKQRQQRTEHRLEAVNKRIGPSTSLSRHLEISIFLGQFIEHLVSKENKPMRNGEIPKKQRFMVDLNSPEEMLAIDEAGETTNLEIMGSEKCLSLEGKGDDLVCENEDEVTKDQSKVVLELEDLIGELPYWTVHVKELMQKSGLSGPSSQKVKHEGLSNNRISVLAEQTPKKVMMFLEKRNDVPRALMQLARNRRFRNQSHSQNP